MYEIPHNLGVGGCSNACPCCYCQTTAVRNTKKEVCFSLSLGSMSHDVIELRLCLAHGLDSDDWSPDCSPCLAWNQMTGLLIVATPDPFNWNQQKQNTVLFCMETQCSSGNAPLTDIMHWSVTAGCTLNRRTAHCNGWDRLNGTVSNPRFPGDGFSSIYSIPAISMSRPPLTSHQPPLALIIWNR